VIDQRGHLTVVLLRAHHHLLAALRRPGHHQVDQLLIALHLRAHNPARNVLLVVDDLFALVQRVKSLKVVKSVIHAVFAPPHKSAINHVFGPASLNQIFPKMSQGKSLRKVFAQSY
jgi:hypothetical protein